QASAHCALAASKMAGGRSPDHVDRLQRQLQTRALRHPCILTDLEPDLDAANVEMNVPERVVLARNRDRRATTERPRFEPAWLIVDPVPRQRSFRDEPAQFTIDHQGASV